MLQVRRELDLFQKAFGPENRRELGVQHLDRDLAMVLEIFREIHRCHTARAKLALDAVTVGERSAQTFVDLRHFGRAPFVGLRRTEFSRVAYSRDASRRLSAVTSVSS